MLETQKNVSLMPGLGRYPGGGNGNPLQYSCLENPMDRETWWATVHGVTNRQTRLSNWACTPYHPVAVYGCESWPIKKTERWRTDVFKLWFWRRFLRVPWKARRSHQSNHFLKEINPEYSLEGLMLKLKRQYFCHLMQRADSPEKTLMLGKTKQEKRATKDKMVGWHHWINEHEFEQTLGDNKR